MSCAEKPAFSSCLNMHMPAATCLSHALQVTLGSQAGLASSLCRLQGFGLADDVYLSALQVVQLFDSWAHYLTPGQFAEFGLPYAAKVISLCRQRCPSTPLIYHAKGGAGFCILSVTPLAQSFV